MALDPGFTTGRPYVYVLYAYDKAPDSHAAAALGRRAARRRPAPTADGCVISGRLSRLGADRRRDRADRGLVPAVPEPLDRLARVRARRACSTSAPATAPRSTGPTTARTAARSTRAATRRARTLTPPTSQGGALRASRFRRPAAQPAALDGAILRVNPDTGAAAAGNPAIANADPNRRRIVAYGFRNPFRFTFRPGHGRDLVRRRRLEHVGGDQPHRRTSRRSATTAGRATRARRGWAPTTRSNLDSCETLYAQGAGAVTAPYFAYHHAEQGRRRRDVHDRLVLDLRPAFYTGDAFPAAYQDALFFSDYSRNCIWVMYKGANGLPDLATRQTFAAGADGPVWLTQGPDGALYYADLARRHGAPDRGRQQRADGADRRRRRRAARRR